MIDVYGKPCHNHLMATMNISLPQTLRDHVEHWVATGEYANASDFVRTLIREKMDQQRSLDDLIQEGLDSGESVELDRDAFLEQLMAETDLDEAA